MEKWKIATIAVLLLGLLGFGIAQQNADRQRNQNPAPAPSGTPLPSPYIGQNLPPWNFKTWNTKPVSFQSLEGSPAFIEIFRTGCSHCQDAAPFTTAIHKRYAPRGLKMVGIQSPGDFKDTGNPENSWPAVQTWLKNAKITHPIAHDDGSKYYQGTIQKQLLGNDPSKLLYPTMLLTDKTGKIDFAQTGHDLSKAIALAVELEKRFPTSDDAEKNAADLAKWLNANLPELKINGPLTKAFTDDIAQRLKTGS